MARETGGTDDVRTRQKVLACVLDNGPVSASKVAGTMGLTAAAIRRHLDALCEEGLIEVRSLAGVKAGRGRPARQYVVTAEGHSAISHEYDGLAVDVLGFVEEKAGREAVGEFARRHAEALRERLAARMDRNPSTVAGRSRELAGALVAEGYAATASPVAVGTPLEAMQLCQGHCPIQQVAEEYPEFCEAELDMFSEHLGVDVRRLSTLAGGGHVCTTHIPTSVLNRPLIDQKDNNQGGSR
ncbi:helix-turn-helix transcriptional regulator [Brevibacterium litoralis]|uniref:helix-turn-helix transcriptional regulator n=1 Tax=Brevibacterium litoralis TaxID=3138935 RepID=UPI0032EC066E